jgi:hypothetical protein
MRRLCIVSLVMRGCLTARVPSELGWNKVEPRAPGRVLAEPSHSAAPGRAAAGGTGAGCAASLRAQLCRPLQQSEEACVAPSQSATTALSCCRLTAYRE